MSKTPPVAYLSYDNLRTMSEAFLEEHHPSGDLPVPIENIIELRLGLSIVLKGALRELCNVDGFVSADCSVIYIDAEVYLHRNLNRCRFSLAEELSHIILHKRVMEALSFGSMPEYRKAIASIDEDSRGWLEFQAKSFAGLILVPSAQLKEEYERLDAHVDDFGDSDFRRDQIIAGLAETFSVSTEVITRRLAKEQPTWK